MLKSPSIKSAMLCSVFLVTGLVKGLYSQAQVPASPPQGQTSIESNVSDPDKNWAVICKASTEICSCLLEKIKAAPAETSEEILSFKVSLSQAQRKMKPQTQTFVRESIASCNTGEQVKVAGTAPEMPKVALKWKKPELTAPENRNTCRLENYFSQKAELRTSSAGTTVKGMYPTAANMSDCLKICRADQEIKLKTLTEGVVFDSRCLFGGKELFAESLKSGDQVNASQDQQLARSTRADLHLFRTSKTDKAILGKPYEVTFRLKNLGPEPAENIELDLNISSALKVVLVNPELGGSVKIGDGRYKVKTSSLDPEAVWKVAMSFEVIGEGTVNISGSVKSDSFDADMKNNSAQVSESVVKPPVP